MYVLAIILCIIIAMVSITLAIISNPIWVIVMLSATIAYGFLSPVIASRRLYFLASASPHSALLATITAIPLAMSTPINNVYFWALIVGLILIYFVGYLIHSGLDPDIATALFVSFTSSTSVIALYYVLTRYPIETDLTTIIIGDPLLSNWSDALIASSIALVSLVFIIVSYCEQVCIGVDRVSTRLTGIRVWFYDLIVFTLLALTTVLLIRIVGFVLEHVLILLPASIAINVTDSARRALFISVLASIVAGLTGLYMAILFDIAPAGATGLTLLAMYVAGLLLRGS